MINGTNAMMQGDEGSLWEMTAYHYAKYDSGSARTGSCLSGGDKNMIMVKKRDGRKEPFVAEKIVVSAIKSGAPVDVARTIASDIEKNATDGIATKELKKMVLGRLKTKNPEWERNWMVFDTAVKKRPE
jgi:transcriptional repressor NrdR